jgi:hypothetical protein
VFISVKNHSTDIVLAICKVGNCEQLNAFQNILGRLEAEKIAEEMLPALCYI